MSHSFGFAIESLVAILLILTIGYCMLLNTRLKRLKADEHSLKATIAELITATEIAERAIGGLKHTAARPAPEPEPVAPVLSPAKAVAAAAQAFSDRRRSDGIAA
jgi:hypothetical protein